MCGTATDENVEADIISHDSLISLCGEGRTLLRH